MFMTACRELLAASWDSLPAGLCRIHADGRARGRASVEGGENAWMRALARMLGFPGQAHDVPVSLDVEPRGGWELWRRRFGDQGLTTRVRVRDGLFAERFRGVEVCFALAGTPRGLEFRQRAAWVALGPLRVPLPGALAPRIEAVDKPGATPDSVDFSVRILLFGRRLVAYGGTLGAES
jgi:hypothetical protein